MNELNPLICGIDEAGRGPLAGPVYAAAVVLGETFDIKLLDDSKKINSKQREEARNFICSNAAFWGIGWSSHEEIDCINILQASLLAMQRAFEALLVAVKDKGLEKSIHVIVDGLFIPEISVPCSALVKADAKIPEVMAASILAKTARDEKMVQYAKDYPEYGYDLHKGYPTKAHRAAIQKYGPSPIQRMTFTVKPVNN